MSAQQAGSGGIFVGKDSSSWFRPTRRTAVFGLLGLLVVLLVGALVWQLIVSHKPAAQPKKVTPSLATGLTSADPTVQQLGGSQAALDAKIAAASTPEAKADLYIQKMSLGYALNESAQQILSYGQKAEELAPSVSSAQALAVYYQRQNDNVNAAKYYRLMVSRMDAAYRTAHPADADHYSQIAAGLESSR